MRVGARPPGCNTPAMSMRDHGPWLSSTAHGERRIVPPLLIINPATDIEFVRACHAELAEAGASPVRLQVALRLLYPDAVVRPRELSGETIILWYVYREGHWVSST